MKTIMTETIRPMKPQPKITEIYVRGYDCEFMVKIENDFYLSFEQADAWVKKEIVDTAIVKKIVQKWITGDLTILNK